MWSSIGRTFLSGARTFVLASAPRVGSRTATTLLNAAVPALRARTACAFGATAFSLGFAGLALKEAQAAEAPIYGVPGTKTERTFIAIKPDGVQRGLIGEIIGRFEKKGYKLVAIRVVVPTESFAAQHYDDLKARPFFPKLVKYFSSGPVIAMVWEGKNVISEGRKLIGATNPVQSEPGSIRGDLCIDVGRNIIHGSDSPDAAKHEISLWFKPADVGEYNLANVNWVFE